MREAYSKRIEKGVLSGNRCILQYASTSRLYLGYSPATLASLRLSCPINTHRQRKLTCAMRPLLIVLCLALTSLVVCCHEEDPNCHLKLIMVCPCTAQCCEMYQRKLMLQTTEGAIHTGGRAISASVATCLCGKTRSCLPAKALIWDYTRSPRSHRQLITVLTSCAGLRSFRHVLLCACQV